MTNPNPYHPPTSADRRIADSPSVESGIVFHWIPFCMALLVILGTFVACVFCKKATTEWSLDLMQMGGSATSQMLGNLSAVTSGLTMSAPVWPALFLMFAPIAPRRRMVIAAVWLAVISILTGVGNSLQTPMEPAEIHQPEFAVILSGMFCGWCVVPFAMMNFGGWQLRYGSGQGQRDSSFLVFGLAIGAVLVWLVAGSLYFESTTVLVTGAVGFVVTACLGIGLVVSFWILMRSRRFVLWWVGLPVLLSAICFFGSAAIYGYPDQDTYAAVMAAAFGASVASAIGFARLGGFRLVTGGGHRSRPDL